MMTTPQNSSDMAIRRALEILAQQMGGSLITGDDDGNGGHGGSGGGGGSSSGSSGGSLGGGAMGSAAQQAANQAGASSGGGATNASSSSLPPELSALMNLMMERMRFQENLFRSVTNQAYRGLPTYARWTGSNGGATGAIGPGV